MFGHYRNTGIPRIRDYGEAMCRFNNTRPIRGRTDPSRPQYPLGHRSKVDSFHMKRCPFTQDVEFYLYRTPVITFKPDGEVWIKSDGWDTISTSNFLTEALSGIHAQIYDRNLCIGFTTAERTEWHRVPTSGTLKLKRGEDRRWALLNPTECYTHSVNRKAANNVRRRYKDFIQYAKAMIKLKNGEFMESEYEAAFGVNPHGQPNYPRQLHRHSWSGWEEVIAQFKECISNESEDQFQYFYKALLMLARSYTTSYYGITNTLPLQAFDKGMTDMLFGLHRDEVLVRTPVEHGRIVKDRYGRYFRGGWGKLHTA